jgi:flagellar M-ring protein FliF
MLQRLLGQISNFWNRQRSSQRIILIALLAILLILVPVLVVWAATPSYAVAFSSLSEKDAADMVTQLQTENIPYQMRGTNTILVPTNQVYNARLIMARAGLPQQSNVGFELFSGNTLGMTEFTQKVNYQRALEGELERTIGSMDQIQAVRVHIVTPDQALFATEQMPTTASVTIQVKPSKTLDAAGVRAISFLVANSVEGLTPENVAVVDTEGNLLAAGSGGAAGSGTQVDSRRSAEVTAANDIQKKVKNLIDTALGPNRSVVQVSVSLDWSEKQVTTQTFDPTPIAVRSSQALSESYSTDGQVIAGVPGATSNLPGAIPTTTAGTGQNLVYNRSELTNNYELSKSETQQTIHPGEVNRVSLSVLVDGVTDPAQLQTLQSAISAAAGIDQDRGDVISVQSLVFDKTYAATQSADLASSQRNTTIITIVQISAIVLVAGFLFWYILRLLKNLRMASVEVWTPVLKPMAELATLPMGGMGGMGMGRQIPIEQMIGQAEPEPAPVVLPPPRPKKMEVIQTPEEEQMQRVVSRLADDNPARVAEIIQLWLNEDRSNQ